MGWAVEKNDLLGIYPKFRNWLEHGGLATDDKQESKWYNYPQGSSYINPKEH